MTAGLATPSWRIASGPPPPGSRRLRPGDLDLWRFPLDLPPAEVTVLRRVLSAEERSLADRRIFARHRDMSVVARARLRQILAGHLGVSPELIELTFGRHGKPRLAAPGTRLGFNLSHSGGWGLLGVAAGAEAPPDVGVDIEAVRTDRDLRGLAGRFFSPSEARSVVGAGDDDLGDAFHHCWVRKEAYLKVRGDGMSLPLDSFEVSLPPAPASLLHSELHPGDVARYSWIGLEPMPGYAAAVAVTGKVRRMEGAVIEATPKGR